MNKNIVADNELEQILREISRLTSEKSNCSHSLGIARRNNQQSAELEGRMRAIKQELKQLRQKKKLLESSVVSDAIAKTETGDLPGRFTTACAAQTAHSKTYRVASHLESTADTWDKYVELHPCSSPYHRSIFRKIITDSFGKEDHSLMAFDQDDNVMGVLPLLRLKSRLFGDFLVSMPYLNYGGVLSSNQLAEAALLEKAFDVCSTLGVQHMELRELVQRTTMACRSDKVSMILELPSSYEELMAKLGSKLRAQVKRAEREKVSTRIGAAEILDDFYKVFSVNMRDLGTPVYSKSIFRSILESPETGASVLVVYLGSRPVACAFLIGYRDVLEIPWASTLREVNALSINMYLYSRVLDYAIKNSYRFFDFGRSTKDSGTYHFKKQWGAVPLQNHWNYWLANTSELPQLNPSNPRYKLMIKTWQKMPTIITNLLGPAIVKHLP